MEELEVGGEVSFACSLVVVRDLELEELEEVRSVWEVQTDYCWLPQLSKLLDEKTFFEMQVIFEPLPLGPVATFVASKLF